VVVDGFFHFAGERYKLLAFVVMPSHHHWLFLPDPEWCEQLVIRQQKSLRKRTPREVISHSIQSYTATQCNRLLELSGSFWQTETFDHYARDESEAMKIIDYIENNPVVSGLVETPESYRFSSACYRKQHGIPRGYPLPVR
jgi:type I restriction enzyme R subunit